MIVLKCLQFKTVAFYNELQWLLFYFYQEHIDVKNCPKFSLIWWDCNVKVQFSKTNGCHLIKHMFYTHTYTQKGNKTYKLLDPRPPAILWLFPIVKEDCLGNLHTILLQYTCKNSTLWPLFYLWCPFPMVESNRTDSVLSQLLPYLMKVIRTCPCYFLQHIFWLIYLSTPHLCKSLPTLAQIISKTKHGRDRPISFVEKGVNGIWLSLKKIVPTGLKGAKIGGQSGGSSLSPLSMGIPPRHWCIFTWYKIMYVYKYLHLPECST